MCKRFWKSIISIFSQKFFLSFWSKTPSNRSGLKPERFKWAAVYGSKVRYLRNGKILYICIPFVRIVHFNFQHSKFFFQHNKIRNPRHLLVSKVRPRVHTQNIEWCVMNNRPICTLVVVWFIRERLLSLFSFISWALHDSDSADIVSACITYLLAIKFTIRK